MRKFAWLITLSWHEDQGIHTRTETGTYEAEAFETMTSVQENVMEEARSSLGITWRKEAAVLAFWLERDEAPAE